MMTKFGVRDYSETVHTVGLNYITAIGRFVDGVTSSLSECPVFPYSERSHYGQMVAESQASYSRIVFDNALALKKEKIFF